MHYSEQSLMDPGWGIQCVQFFFHAKIGACPKKIPPHLENAGPTTATIKPK